MEYSKLIALCINGNKTACKELFELYYSYLYKVAFMYVRTVDTTKEIVQLTYIKIFSNLKNEKFVTELHLKMWMRKICIRTSIDEIRKTKNYIMEDIQLQNQIKLDETINAKLQLEDVIKQIENLNSPLKEVIKLFAIEGFNHKEIAELLGISDEYSRVCLSNARKVLKNYYSQAN